MRTLAAILTLASLPILAQDSFANVAKPGDSICPRTVVTNDPNLVYGAGRKLGAGAVASNIFAEGHVFYEPKDRKDVSAFTVYSKDGKPTSIASLKGKNVVVGLWSINCDPSARMVIELADLYPRREKFNFEILAVNFDTIRGLDSAPVLGGWPAVKQFETSNRAFFKEHPLPFYLPGNGKEGASNLLNQIDSVPLLAVIDPNGKLASLDLGYTPQLVAQRLSRLIKEEQNAKAAK